MACARPSFQFYPRDWTAHSGLAGCSLAARGLWMALVCLAHDAPTYGRLLNADGSPMSIESLARRVGETPARVRRLVDELLTNGVGARGADGALESPRMMRDEARRLARAAGGALGGNPALKVGPKDNREVNLPADSEVKLAPTPAVAVAFAVASELPTTSTAGESLRSTDGADAKHRGTSPVPVRAAFLGRHSEAGGLLAELDAKFGADAVDRALTDLDASGKAFAPARLRNFTRVAAAQAAEGAAVPPPRTACRAAAEHGAGGDADAAFDAALQFLRDHGGYRHVPADWSARLGEPIRRGISACGGFAMLANADDVGLRVLRGTFRDAYRASGAGPAA